MDGDAVVIRAADHRRERWRNGAGWTREIHAERSPGGWDWRLSIAEIEQDAPFSSFPGVERELVLRSGKGLRLHVGGGETLTVRRPDQSARFAGESAVSGELIDGPVQAFNLMWRRDSVTACCRHRRLTGALDLQAAPGESWALHLLTGGAQLADHAALAAGDTLLLRAGAAPVHRRLHGDGDLLIIRVAARPR